MFPIAFHPIYQHPLPEGHRFPMLKYELLPQQLLHEGTALESNFSRGICDLHPVLAIHKQEYVNDLIQLTLNPKAARKMDFLFQRTY
jgi:acetoin utilization deacetylase AcuC-like enzyme